MSTDMYGVRILEVDPERRHAKIQVLVVYYDTESRTHALLPNDEPGTFLHFLWESAKGHLDNKDPRKGPIGEVLTTDDILNYEWVDTNARRFISGGIYLLLGAGAALSGTRLAGK